MSSYANATAPGPWKPRPWDAELAGCVWIGRMLDKGRRALEGARNGHDLLGEYLFGDDSPVDSLAFEFLRTRESKVRALLAQSDDDGDVAAQLIRDSGRTVIEVALWNPAFRLVMAAFIPLWECDEGRHTGPIADFTKLAYNVSMPPVAAASRFMGGLRRTFNKP